MGLHVIAEVESDEGELSDLGMHLLIYELLVWYCYNSMQGQIQDLQ